jgi:hypothetical protein
MASTKEHAMATKRSGNEMGDMMGEARGSSFDADQDARDVVHTTLRRMMPNVDVDAWMGRTGEMLKDRPGITIAAAVGTGFVLGLTLFSKIGRIALIGAMGLGTELLIQRARTAIQDDARQPA